MRRRIRKKQVVVTVPANDVTPRNLHSLKSLLLRHGGDATSVIRLSGPGWSQDAQLPPRFDVAYSPALAAAVVQAMPTASVVLQ